MGPTYEKFAGGLEKPGMGISDTVMEISAMEFVLLEDCAPTAGGEMVERVRNTGAKIAYVTAAL
jgi:hypothetical protein